MQITYPKHNMVFTVDTELRREYQAAVFTAAIDERALRTQQGASDARPEWWIDGKKLERDSTSARARGGEPYSLLWRLEAGKHTLELQAGSVRSARVRFTVINSGDASAAKSDD